jgi:hypothetical protein
MLSKATFISISISISIGAGFYAIMSFYDNNYGIKGQEMIFIELLIAAYTAWVTYREFQE